jgi:hypothetical protein
LAKLAQFGQHFVKAFKHHVGQLIGHTPILGSNDASAQECVEDVTRRILKIATDHAAIATARRIRINTMPSAIRAQCGMMGAIGSQMASRILALALIGALAIAWIVAVIVTTRSLLKKTSQRREHLGNLALLSVPIVLIVIVKLMTDYAASLGVEL